MTTNDNQNQNKSAASTVATTKSEGDGGPPVDAGSAFRTAYDKRLPEIMKVPDDEFVRLNLDVHATVATILGALPEIKALRPAMSGLPGLNQDYVDALEDYALATGEANSRFVLATTPPEDINAMNDRALSLRETLKSDATALAHPALARP